MFVSIPDLLRVAVVPALAWTAYRDVRTRRVPNWIWLPLVAVGFSALVLDTLSIYSVPVRHVRSVFLLRVAVSLGVVAPLGYAFWRLGGFGGADAKAIMTLALVFPTYPVLYVPWAAFPLEQSTLGVFSLTILTNTILISIGIPIVLAGRNAVNGRVTRTMFVGRPIPIDRVTGVYGRLLQRGGMGITGGLDLDALRMYLRWRGASLESMRSMPAIHRDPASIPSTPNDPGDGSLAGAESDSDSDGITSPDPSDRTEATPHASDDPWGASAFLSNIDGDAYGTTPEQLRTGLDLLCASETESVWVSPGLPFLVVVFLGLVIALTHGDLLSTIVSVALL